MFKEVERAGIPVVHICTVTPISMTVGANRIVPTIAIPHPLGNPALTREEEYEIRKALVEKAKEEAVKNARETISYAIQKCAADHSAETTVSIVPLPSDDIKGRII